MTAPPPTHPLPYSAATPAQAAQFLLGDCGLPAAWAHAPQWRVLNTGAAQGLQFLLCWLAWREDPARPQLLHYVAASTVPFSAESLLAQAGQDRELQPLARQLGEQCWGLLPGVHRLRLEGGRVILTLLIGEQLQALLRQQELAMDSIFLNPFNAAQPPDAWDLHTLKAVARCARRGAGLACYATNAQLERDLVQCGFVLQHPGHGGLRAHFDPAWEQRKAPLWPRSAPVVQPPGAAQARQAVVVGAGLAGAACAQQLALRGWQVTVLDAAAQPAAGASGLPAGIFAPHTSSDDSMLSRISRAGLRTTLQWAQQLLQHGQDWEMTGVLERRQLATPANETAAHTDTPLQPARRHSAHERPAAWSAELAEAAAPWSQPASAAVLQALGLPSGDAALWHEHAGWLRPAALVQALLQHAGARFVGNAAVARIAAAPDQPAWCLLDAQGQALAQAELVILAAGPHTAHLDCGAQALPLPLQAIRGQVSWGPAPAADDLPRHPVNGHGSWIPLFIGAAAGEPAWIMGSSFERDVTQLPPSPAEQAQARAEHWRKLQSLLPQASEPYAAAFAQANSWAQVRCAAPDRLPLVGPLPISAEQQGDRLPPWVCTAMGSRGLSWALLCAELLAARLHGEPLPLPNGLAKALALERYA